MKKIKRSRTAVELSSLLTRRGYRDPGKHAAAFASGGYSAADLLATEKRHGKFPVSSPAGPLVKAKKSNPRCGRWSKAKRKAMREAAKRAAPKKRAKKKSAPKKIAKRAAPKRAPARRTKAQSLARTHWWLGLAKQARHADRAMLSAGYLKLSAREREAFVKKLARGGPKKKRAAIAIARAEQARAEGPPRKRNPGMSDADAAREYERTHWGERGTGRVRERAAADPTRGTATEMGELIEVTYRTKKRGDDELTDYVHAFEGPRPKLLYNAGGLIVAGGRYTVRKGGITG